MANMYRSVLAGGGGVQPTGDAVEANVLAGKTFSNASGVGKTGTMPNRGAVSQTISGGQSYTIPEGYHNGSGTVTATGATINTSFTPTGASGGTLGTNFVVDRYYVLEAYSGVSLASLSFTGATIVATGTQYGSDAVGYTKAVLLKATASTIVSSVTPFVGQILAEIY